MSSTALVRTLDASLNRAAEGLRVIEDYLRFALDDAELTATAKQIRHDLAKLSGELPDIQRYAARDTPADVGIAIQVASELQRDSSAAVSAASFQRVKQSLRSLEEYGKLLDGRWAVGWEALRYRVYTLEKMVGISSESRARWSDVRLQVLVDGRASTGAFAELVDALVDAGVDAIQLRDKKLDDRALLARARMLRERTRSTPVLSIVNDRPDLARLADVDAVHLGQDDLSVKDVRTIVGPDMVVGVSTHCLADARAAVAAGANYLGAGPTFPSATKQFDHFAGLAYLQELATTTRLPAFAIGGIRLDNLAEVLATGIHGIAVASAITASPDPAAAVRQLRAAWSPAPV